MATLEISNSNNKIDYIPLIDRTLGQKIVPIKPYLTHTVSSGNELAFTVGNNWKLTKGHTYQVEAIFRPRGDGQSTPNKCSSIGFIAFWDDLASSYSSIHYSGQAYEEQGRFVRFFYEFTSAYDVQPQGTGLYFIINNGWACGADNQTIDLYYYRYQDMSDPSNIDERGTKLQIMEIDNAVDERQYFQFLYNQNLDKKYHFFTKTFKGIETDYYPINITFSSVNEGLSCNLLSEGSDQPISMGNLYKFKIDAIQELTVSISGYDGDDIIYSDVYFYDSWAQSSYDAYYNYDRWYQKGLRYTYAVNKKAGHSIASTIYVYFNNSLIYSGSYRDSYTFKEKVKPGDTFYIKIVSATSDEIVYNSSTYGGYYEVKEVEKTSGSGWNKSHYWDYNGDINNYITTQSSIDTAIRNGNSSYGYVTQSGDSSLSTSGLGTKHASACNFVTISTNPLNYDDFVSTARR
jgi:hypothetical protein